MKKISLFSLNTVPYVLLAFTALPALSASAAAPGTYAGKLCWSFDFTAGTIETVTETPPYQYFTKDISFVAPSVMMKLYATHIGGDSYLLEGNIIDNRRPNIMGSIVIKAQAVDDKLQYVRQKTEDIIIDLVSGEWSSDASDRVGPVDFSWATDSSLEGPVMLDYFGSDSYLYVPSSGVIVSEQEQPDVMGESYLVRNLTGHLSPMACDRFPDY